MLKNDFEKYMKNNLESARWDWDKEEMWADIEKNLPPVKEPNRVFPIWWVSGFLVASIIIVALFMLDRIDNNITKIVTENQVTFDVENPIENGGINTAEKRSQNVNQESNLDNSNSITTGINNNEDSNNNSEEPNASNNKIQANNSTATVSVEKSDVIQNTTISKIVNKSTAENQKVGLNENTTFNSLPNNNKTSEEITNANLSDTKNTDQRSALEKMIDKHNSAFSQTRLLGVAKIGNVSAQLTTSNNFVLDLPLYKTQNTFIKPAANKFHSSLALYSNYSLLNRNLTSLVSEDDLLGARTNAEQTLEGIGVQLNYRLRFSKNVFAEIGVEYQRLNEVMNFEESISTQEVIQSDSASYFINFAGETKFLAGENTRTRIQKTRYNSYNEHHFVNTPIHIGYMQRVGAFSVSIVTGPVLNIYQSYKGDAISDELKFASNIEVADFDSSLISAFDTGIYLDYNITNDLSLSSGINYRKALSSFTIDRVITQSYNKVDFKLGLLFKL